MINQTETMQAGYCGLYCEACTNYIATTEDAERLTELAAQFGKTEEEVTCYGCRSGKKGSACGNCKFAACAFARDVDFCVECDSYPCDGLREFQSEKQNRQEMREDLSMIKIVGYDLWIYAVREHYTCPKCGTLNSAYDPSCRACGNTPSCRFIAENWIGE